MGMAVGGSGEGPKAEINVTPLVDVCLVLLIIFMVVTPLLQRNKEVELPVAKNIAKSNREEDPLTISVTSDSKAWVGNKAVEISSIRQVVADAIKEAPNREVIIKGDVKLTVGPVRLVMHEVQLSGARKVGLGVEKPEGEP